MSESVEDLTAWLTAVWDEEERLAREASEEGTGVFRPHWSPVEVPFEGISLYSDGAGGGYEDSVTRHIGAHDPASVLAQIAADRTLIKEYTEARRAYEQILETFAGDDSEGAKLERFGYGQVVAALGIAVRIRATAWRGRPDFPEWLVERQGVEK